MPESSYSGGGEFQLKKFYVSFQMRKHARSKHKKHPEKTRQSHNQKQWIPASQPNSASASVLASGTTGRKRPF
jgi:hypothetical protein